MKAIVTGFLVCLLTAVMYSHAQSRLIVHEDTRVQLLYHQRDSIIICFTDKKVPGYRILVSKTDNRDAAYQLKHTLQTRYTGYSVYMSYQTPYFKLKLGDFILENEAEAFNTGLGRDLKLVTTVIPDKIYKRDEQPCMEKTHLPLYVSK